MPKTLTLLLLISSTGVFGQSNTIFIKHEYERVPSLISKSPIKLAKYLTENDSSEFQQALNIYTWIIHNIKYDIKAAARIKSRRYSPKQTLRRKKGICYQYSSLFAALCQNAGISSREIIGYSRGFTYHEDDRFFEADHSWNSIKLDSTWYLIDATWGSGILVQRKRWFKELMFRCFKTPYVNDRYKFQNRPNYNYFLIDPKILIIDHLPVDPNWQLVDFPISLNTFESYEWESYLPKMDSIYHKQIDSLEYVRKLNKYEYLSNLQYLVSTAEQSSLFNPKNLKLNGLSSHSLASSYENTTGNMEQRAVALGQAINLYKQATSQLKRHQKIALSESNKMIKTSRYRISSELRKPVSDRKKKNDRENRRAESFLKKEQRVVNSHRNQVLKLQNIISRPSRQFTIPAPAKTEKTTLVEKNKSKIKNALIHSAIYKDSAVTLIISLKEHIARRKSIQAQILLQYEELAPSSAANIRSIVQNQMLSQVSNSMQSLVANGQKVDSLNTIKRELDRKINLQKRAIRQLHSSVISYSSEIRKMILQNCQFSKNKDCEATIYDQVTSDIRSVYVAKKSLESELLNVAINDAKISKRMVELTGKLQKILETNAEFISLFQDKRLGGISFKLKRSNFETNQLIADSQKRTRRLTFEMSRIKRELRKRKGM